MKILDVDQTVLVVVLDVLGFGAPRSAFLVGAAPRRLRAKVSLGRDAGSFWRGRRTLDENVVRGGRRLAVASNPVVQGAVGGVSVRWRLQTELNVGKSRRWGSRVVGNSRRLAGILRSLGFEVGRGGQGVPVGPEIAGILGRCAGSHGYRRRVILTNRRVRGDRRGFQGDRVLPRGRLRTLPGVGQERCHGETQSMRGSGGGLRCLCLVGRSWTGRWRRHRRGHP